MCIGNKLSGNISKQFARAALLASKQSAGRVARPFGTLAMKPHGFTLHSLSPAARDLTHGDANSSWLQVRHGESGKIYYWNTITNETTALGAPHPNPEFNSDANPKRIALKFAVLAILGAALGLGAHEVTEEVAPMLGVGGLRNDDSLMGGDACLFDDEEYDI